MNGFERDDIRYSSMAPWVLSAGVINLKARMGVDYSLKLSVDSIL